MHLGEVVDAAAEDPATNLLGAVLRKTVSLAPLGELDGIQFVHARLEGGSRLERGVRQDVKFGHCGKLFDSTSRNVARTRLLMRLRRAVGKSLPIEA